jgi:uncharacterized protein (TIGR03437 family)
MFVAAPATASLTNASLNGAYTISGFFPGSTAASSSDVSYELNPNGAGSLGSVTISGTSGGGTNVTQTSSGVTYKFSSGAAIVNFPTNNNASFYSGANSIFMYMSADSNFVFGGSPTGYDMFVGVKNASGGASTPLSGLYYEAGLDANEGTGLDTYYGSLNTFSGNVIGHERIAYSNATGEGFTYYSSYPTTLAGSYQDPSGSTKYTIGQNGFRIGAGIGQYLSIEVGIPYTPPVVTTGTYIDPSGFVNTASSAPYTAGISPGEFITLYNNNGTNFAAAGALIVTPNLPALTTSLAGIKVLVDGIAAPIYYVTTNAISFVVPYEVSTYGVASIQVSVNGALSNVVTTYVHQTAPGVFTLPTGGIGVSALVDYPASGTPFVVGTDNPANPGDTVALFLTGLGSPFPSNSDGATGGVTCLSGTCLVNDVAVDIGGVDVGTLAFAGSAPQQVSGLYQINFQVPPICATSTSTSCFTSAGNYTLGVTGLVAVTGGELFDSYSDEALIPVGSGTGSSVRAPETPHAPTKAAPARQRTLMRLNNTGNR